MIRLTFLLRRRAEFSPTDFHDYWLNEHGPLVASVARKINALRYVQIHTLNDQANAAMAAARGGMEAAYDGVAEVYFENRDALVDALGTAAGQQAAATLLEDEAGFIDFKRSAIWVGKEHVFVDHR